MERDLGYLDTRRVEIITGLKRSEEFGTSDKLLGYLLKASRRDEVSEATIRTIKKLSVKKQQMMEQMAHKFLPPFEFTVFKKKFDSWFERPVRIRPIVMKIPFGTKKLVARGVISRLRTVI